MVECRLAVAPLHAPPSSSSLAIVRLPPLMERTCGRPEVAVGLLDGPLAVEHPDLATEHIRDLSGRLPAGCTELTGTGCRHGTFVAGILVGRRGSAAPAICPDCTLLVRPIFADVAPGGEPLPGATCGELGAALVATVDAGARVINISAALGAPSVNDERVLAEALDYSARRGAIVVAAAGNQGTVGSSAITRHPWVIPVAACDLRGRPLRFTNLGASIGRRGLSAPGEGVASLAAEGASTLFGGTSVAAPLVTGTIALLWSAFPAAEAADIRCAISQAGTLRRRSVVPPVLDAWGAYQFLTTTQARGAMRWT